MRSVAIVAALVGAAAAAPQAVTSKISPAGEVAPTGCSSNYNGQFQVVVQTVSTKKRSVEKRDSTALEVTLKDGVLTDAQGRTGYIASNNQFQFDGPVQAGAIYTAGWSVCTNGSLALGNSAIFYQCLSGSFYNLYDENDADQCTAVYLAALGTAATTTTASGAAKQISDGQVTGSAVPVTHSVICQIGDGQIQQNTCITTATPTGVVITQISDGQIQAPTSTVTGAKITQISDGQIQAPTSTVTGAKITQISDGQIQAPTSSVTGAKITQISDGQIQAPTNATVQSSAAKTSAAKTTTASAYTGAAAMPTAGLFGLIAGVVALAAL